MGADPETKRSDSALTTPPVKPASSSGFQPTMPPRMPMAGPVFAPGELLAGRYEIVSMLGRGGMGAVYRARDRELDRDVALKVIRPDLAEAEGMLERFKQEIVLARQVTHRNAVRIYDLGEADGLKFLTMEYVEGRDLATHLRESGPMPPAEASATVLQICRALEAAHGESVIHRDLKPQNIMLESSGRVVVMDFGLARSLDSAGMTQTGAMVGTLEYMAPEQALGKEVGPPADIFATGLIFYELLTGKMPFEAESALASLFKRTHGERARPISEINRSIPRALSDIVARCIEADPKRRYPSAAELARAVEPWAAGAPAPPFSFRLPRLGRTGALAAAALFVALVATVVALRWETSPQQPPNATLAQGPRVSLAIVPFRNASGDPSLDWLGTSIAELLTTGVGQSQEVRIVPASRLSQVLRDLRIGGTTELDPAALRRVTDFVSAGTVVSGSFTRTGSSIRIDALLRNLQDDRVLPLKAEAASEQQLPAVVDEIARAVRGGLALEAGAQQQLSRNAFRPSTESMRALRAYNDGLQAIRRGSHLEARQSLEAAVSADPSFALAHAALATSLLALGRDDEAQSAAERARDLAGPLGGIEKQLVLAAHATAVGERSKAIAAYEKVAELWPDDVDVLFALGSNLEDEGELDRAAKMYARIVKIDPRHVNALLASGRVEIKADRSREGLEFLSRAFSLAVQLGDEEAKAAILQAQGVAYKLLNRPQDALRNYEESLAIKRRIGQLRGVGVSLNEIAQIQAQLGDPKARATYEEALRVRRQIGDKSGVGDTLIDLAAFHSDRGDNVKALDLLKQSLQIQREAGNTLTEALCLNNIGAIYFAQGEYSDAGTYFERAYAIREKANVPSEMVDSLHNLAESDFVTGNLEQALRHYVKALEIRRQIGDERGLAIESFSIGNLLFAQAKYDGALQSQQEALKLMRAANERSAWMAQILTGVAATLVESGRALEAVPLLEDAVAIARELKNPALVARGVMVQGDAAFYAGDNRRAVALYGQALRESAQASDRGVALAARLRMQRLNVRENAGGSVSALNELRTSAERLSLKPVALEAELLAAELSLRSRDADGAAQSAARVRMAAERSGYRLLAARAYVVEGQARLAQDPARAAANFQNARALLDSISAEGGSQSFSQRADIAALHNEIDKAANVARR